MQVADRSSAQVTTGVTGVLNHNRTGQAVGARPFLHDDLDATGI